LCLFVAKPLVIAHRGASAEAPENTLAAFRRALALKVDGIELDVQATRDGVPVVFHDEGLRRLTGRIGRLGKKTWPELAALRVAQTEPIPNLAQVLALVRGRATVHRELGRHPR
jgi:glycerophosphoryl diester phosphodiesterase